MKINLVHRFPRDKQIALPSDAMMRHVCYALIPGLLLQVFCFGVGVVIQLGLAILTAVVCEWLNAKLRAYRLDRLAISSGLVTACLLAVSVPATAPWWLVVVGVGFGLLLGKHVFGGVGMNIFNPAVLGFCAVYVSFSAEMSLYPTAYVPLSQTLAGIFSTAPTADVLTDALTGATELAGLKANGYFAAATQTHWWLNGAWLLGGLYLWRRNIADPRLSAVFIGVFAGAMWILVELTDSPISLVQHLGLGALCFTACFIITDPTTAATGRSGRVVYAALAALLAVIIRQYSNMPDSMAFAVLLANLAAPLIDNYTRPQYVRD